jgi:ribosomal protein S18 acetylase RimI-like enzyme
LAGVDPQDGLRRKFSERKERRACIREGKRVSQELSVRIAERRDSQTLVNFNIEMAWETERKKLNSAIVTKGVLGLLETPQRGFYVVAEAAGEIVGSLMVTYEWSDWRCGLFWWIQSVYVAPDFRRRGVFNRLYQFLKDRASRESSLCGFRLYVQSSNRIAQRTYDSAGMKETSYRVYEESFQE